MTSVADYTLSVLLNTQQDDIASVLGVPVQLTICVSIERSSV